MAKAKKKAPAKASVKTQIEIIMAELNSIRSELRQLKAQQVPYIPEYPRTPEPAVPHWTVPYYVTWPLPGVPGTITS